MATTVTPEAPHTTRRAGRAKKSTPAPAPVVVEVPTSDVAALNATEFAPWLAQGTQLRANVRRAKHGFYAPTRVGAPTTTRQAEILNTAAIAAPTDEEGVAIGEDVLSRTIVAFDPFTGYLRRQISSPNVIGIGDVGGGKSSVVKTVYVLRPLVLQQRRCVVFDKKDRGGRGEYSELVEKYGSAPINFSLEGGGAVLNLLDPVIARGAGAGGVMRLLRTIAETANSDVPLDEWQVEALRCALRVTLAQGEGAARQMALPDVVRNLPFVHQGRVELSRTAAERLHQAAASVMFILTGLLEEYSGLFDGETTKGISLTSKLTSFDISQLPPDGPATSMVVAIANMWLLGELRDVRGLFTNVVVDEGWDLIGGASGRLWRSNIKLARGLGMSVITNIHKLADIPLTSPAAAIIQEAQTIHIFRQSRAEDQQRCVETFNLERSIAGSIGNLAIGHHLFKVGSNPEVHLRHIRSAFEIGLTNTDEAMTEAGR